MGTRSGPPSYKKVAEPPSTIKSKPTELPNGPEYFIHVFSFLGVQNRITLMVIVSLNGERGSIQILVDTNGWSNERSLHVFSK